MSFIPRGVRKKRLESGGISGETRLSESFGRFTRMIREGSVSQDRKPTISSALDSLQRRFPQPETGVKYISEGEGKNVLVILPGIGEPTYAHVQNLHLQIPDTRIVVLDYSTFTYPSLSGKLRRPNAQHILSEFQNEMDTFLRGLNAENIILYGISLGGLLAQVYLSGNGEQVGRVSKRIFVQTGALGSEVFDRGFLKRGSIAARVFSGDMLQGLFKVIRRPQDRAITQYMFDDDLASSFVSYAIADYTRKLPLKQVEAIRRLGFAITRAKHGSEVLPNAIEKKPTLIIDNSLDAVFPPKRSGMRTQFSYAKLYDLNSPEGHRASWREVDRILAQVEAFIS